MGEPSKIKQIFERVMGILGGIVMMIFSILSMDFSDKKNYK